MKIAILGYGNFGSGFGSYLSSLGHEIINEEIVGSEIVVVAVPSFAVVPVILKFKNDLIGKKIIICSKGFTLEGKLIGNELKENLIDNVFFLYGPTLVEGIVNGEIFGMVLAGGEDKEEIKKHIQSDKLYLELSDDIVGVQVGAALKNVMTILIGIVEGKGYSKNTRALFFVKCLKEIQEFGVALGADKDTFYGLSCLGDLTLQSRNRQLGYEFGKGRKLDEIIKEAISTIEGVGTIKTARIISKKYNINTPIMDSLYSILFENASIEDSIKKIV